MGVATILTAGFVAVMIGGSAAWTKKIQNDVRKYIRELVLVGKKASDGFQSPIHLSQIETKAREIEITYEKKLAAIKSAHEIGALDSSEHQEKIIKLKKDMEISKKLLFLEDAKSKGVITDEEFDNKKSALMSVA